MSSRTESHSDTVVRIAGKRCEAQKLQAAAGGTGGRKASSSLRGGGQGLSRAGFSFFTQQPQLPPVSLEAGEG